uniref:Uncharacterized protein n=1 Tax=Romanomermis culicivorax TaxID=13658 RepID=A0A915IGH2_ROMCU
MMEQMQELTIEVTMLRNCVADVETGNFPTSSHYINPPPIGMQQNEGREPVQRCDGGNRPYRHPLPVLQDYHKDENWTPSQQSLLKDEKEQIDTIKENMGISKLYQ